MKTVLMLMLLLIGGRAQAFYEAECKSTGIYEFSKPLTWSCPMRECEVHWTYNEETRYYDAEITPECRLPTTKYVFPSQQGTALAHFWYTQFSVVEICYSCRSLR